MMGESPLPSGVNPAHVHELETLLRYAEDGAFVAALYNTAAVRDAIMENLRARLEPLPVYHFTFTEGQQNPLAYLECIPEAAWPQRAIVFIYDIYRAGAPMYGYLEMQREALAQYPHSLVFWLTPKERGLMVRESPNFWSQRSGVFDFTVQDADDLTHLRGLMAGGTYQYVDMDEWERKLRLYRGLVEEYENQENPPVDTLLDLYDKVTGLYYAVSQYKNALNWSKKLLRVAEAHKERKWQGTALNNIGAVYNALGQRETALDYYERALPLREDVGDRAGLATTLTNIGLVYDNLGQRETALDYYERALPIREDVGDRYGESITRYNMAMIFRDQGRLKEAIAQLEKVVALDRLVQSPYLENHTAMLAKVKQELAANS